MLAILLREGHDGTFPNFYKKISKWKSLFEYLSISISLSLHWNKTSQCPHYDFIYLSGITRLRHIRVQSTNCPYVDHRRSSEKMPPQKRGPHYTFKKQDLVDCYLQCAQRILVWPPTKLWQHCFIHFQELTIFTGGIAGTTGHQSSFRSTHPPRPTLSLTPNWKNIFKKYFWFCFFLCC